MFSDDKKRNEVLTQLATKLSVSAHQLSEAARRLQLAELTYREYLGRLRKLDEHMKQLISMLQAAGPDEPTPAPETNPAFCQPPPAKKKLRYADYIEFSNYAELKKFEKMSKISADDIQKCDADDLMKELMDGDPPT